ncbi:MAG: hypothetical protein AAF433_21160 [Bacteroidota bacterium]
MISIYTTNDHLEQLQSWIAEEFRLGELVKVVDLLEERPVSSGLNLLVRKREVNVLLDWYNQTPPYLLPRPIKLNRENFLGLVYANLGNLDRSHELLAATNASLWQEISLINKLRNGLSVGPEELAIAYSPFDDYRLMHNQAIVRHYAATEETFDLEKLQYFYQEAIQTAPDDEHRAFSVGQYATLLTDLGQAQAAIDLLLPAIDQALSQEAKTELRRTLSSVWMGQLSPPYDAELLQQLKSTLWEVLQTYEEQDRPLETGLLLLDAAQVAMFDESFSEALGYISRAIGIFEEEAIAELVGNAQHRRGLLLYTWAQHDNPQFYRPAAESFQEALKVFTRDTAPEVFAEIQQYLGIIYSAIPDEAKKKSIWAAVSSSAFQEALSFYTAEMHPYEYAKVCSHYGNALTKYPAALHTDNFEKALFYYQCALEIRTSAGFPLERAITLLNYLEAAWHKELPEDSFDEAHYQDMLSKANEVAQLTDDPTLLADAQVHLKKLNELKAAYA